MASQDPIEPATVEELRRRPVFAARIPWRYVLPIVTGVALLLGGLRYRELQRFEQRRASLRQRHEKLAALMQKADVLERKLTTFAKRSLEADPSVHTQPVRVDTLRQTPGFYAAMARTQLAGVDGLEDFPTQDTTPDVMRCLGVSATPVDALVTRGKLLDGAWLERVDAADGDLALRVLEDEFRRLSERDLPLVVDMLEAKYFLLIIDEGEDAGLTVWLWNLEAAVDAPALHASRLEEPDMHLVTVALPGAKSTAEQRTAINARHQAGARACGLADALKAQLAAR